METPIQIRPKLENHKNIWVASVRPDGRPHLVPVWFAWFEGKIYLCIEPGSVKARNIRTNPRVSLALEDGTQPVICEGRAHPLGPPWPVGVQEIFRKKYDWDISTENQYTQLVEVSPEKWLDW